MTRWDIGQKCGLAMKICSDVAELSIFHNTITCLQLAKLKYFIGPEEYCFQNPESKLKQQT